MLKLKLQFDERLSRPTRKRRIL